MGSDQDSCSLILFCVWRSRRMFKEKYNGRQGGNFLSLHRKDLRVMDCNGISTKIPAWKFHQQVMKASATGQGEAGVCLSAVLRCPAQGESREDLEGEDKQLMLDKTEQGDPSIGIQKRWHSKESCKKPLFIKAFERILTWQIMFVKVREKKVIIIEIQNAKCVESSSYMCRQGTLYLTKFCRKNLQNLYGDCRL